MVRIYLESTPKLWIKGAQEVLFETREEFETEFRREFWETTISRNVLLLMKILKLKLGTGNITNL